MNIDKFGQTFFTSDELVGLLYKNPEIKFENLPVIDPEKYNKTVTDLYLDYPKLSKYVEATDIDIEEFDKRNQANWFMPEQYLNFDIETWLLDHAKTDLEKNRVSTELDLYRKNDMIILLKYLMYLVDVLKKNNIVWGVGRGSSVASYCLYLLGIHKINSLKYNLDIKEFFK